MELTRAQKVALIRDGYVQIPGVVARPAIDRALRAINQDLGQGIDPAQLWRYQAQSFCPEVRTRPEIRDLFDASGAASLVASAVGAGALRPITEGQIALRFPTGTDAKGEADAAASLPPPHIDGIADPGGTNGVPPGTVLNFTALACVLLSDLPAAFSGNFLVWPGTHRRYAAYLRAHGVGTLMSGMPPVPLPTPVHLTGRAGDLIIAHHLLGHSVAPNHSPHIRYACFFRLWRAGRELSDHAAITDEFREWPGLRPLLASAPDTE